MMTEVDELRAQLDQLAEQLAAAEGRIEEMQRQKAPRRLNKKLVVGAVVGLLALLSLGLYAQVGPSPLITTPEGLLLNLTRRVTALEGEVATLRSNRTAEATGQRVTAPFEVVDREGNVILDVFGDEGVRGMAIYDRQRNTRVAMFDNPERATGQLFVQNDADERVLIGPGSADQMTIQVQNGESKTVAALAIHPVTGTGAMTLYNESNDAAVSLRVDQPGRGRIDLFGAADANARTSLRVEDGDRGVVAVHNAAGVAVAHLFEDPDVAGTGRLYVTDAGGAPAFRAGWTPGDLGAACVNRKNGVWCVGINIPLGIGAGMSGGR